jgi:AcrR family transcriptional regulator
MYARRPETRENPSRRAVLAVVKEMLEEGSFHESTVEEVASRAGVSRATLYQHFGSRLGLIDAYCDVMAENPILQSIRETDDIHLLIERAVDFWASEERALVQLYGAAAVDAAARDFVDRQRRDRYSELHRILRANGRDDPSTHAGLALLTSFETYRELRREAGRSKGDVVRVLQSLSDAV